MKSANFTISPGKNDGVRWRQPVCVFTFIRSGIHPAVTNRFKLLRAASVLSFEPNTLRRH
jgi:hypothetical protein